MEGINGVLQFTSHVTLGTMFLVHPGELVQTMEDRMEVKQNVKEVMKPEYIISCYL